MDTNDLLMTLLLGAVAGWLASALTKGKSLGLAGNIIVGIIGAVVGGYLFGLLGVRIVGITGSILSATFGAVILLYIVKMVKKS